MRGDEKIALHRLTYDGFTGLRLPGFRPYACFEWLDGRRMQVCLNLDGVHLDLSRQKAPWRVDLTWRTWVALCPDFLKAELYYTDLGHPALGTMARCDENGLTQGEAHDRTHPAQGRQPPDKAGVDCFPLPGLL